MGIRNLLMREHKKSPEKLFLMELKKKAVSSTMIVERTSELVDNYTASLLASYQTQQGGNQPKK